MNRTFLIMAMVALLAASGGYFLARNLSPGEEAENYSSSAIAAQTPTGDDLLGRKRPDFTLTDLDGTLVSADDFNGQAWLVNFWATWCTPCVEEMPMLSQLDLDASGQGVRVVGIALDDEDRARRFARELSISYPILVGKADVVLIGRHYGNSTGMLPFSVLVDAAGTIRWTHLGALDSDQLLQQIQLLK